MVGLIFCLGLEGMGGDRKQNGIDIGLRLGQQRVVRSQRQKFWIRREEGKNLLKQNGVFFKFSLLLFF